MEIKMPDAGMRLTATRYRIDVGEADKIYFALVAQYERMVGDLQTHCNGHPNWGQEDVDFLTEEIDKTWRLVKAMYGVDLPVV